MTHHTLVILAAGLGSRYGGDKQVAGVGPGGETLLEFTLCDALRAGIRRAVAVVRPAVADRVAELLRRAPGLDWSLVEQPCPRPRPFGTAHALACAMARVPGAAAVVNADDWYGPGAIVRLAALLDRGTPLALVAHQVGRTLSPHGAVNRGVCRVADGRLLGIQETTGLVPDPAGARHPGGVLSADAPVSLNLWGIGQAVRPFLEARVAGFLATQAAHPTAEIGIPDVVAAWIAAGNAVRTEICDEDWCGLTHAADRPAVVERLERASRAGTYPMPLWSAA